MTEQLKEELARIGETVPPVQVSADTWVRGRRARGRDRLYAGAAVIAVIAVLGGIVGLVRHDDIVLRPVGPVDGSGAIPSTIWDVPERLTYNDGGGHWTGPLEHDLAIGQASLAFTAGRGMPVVVTAEDGRYHLLDLPGWALTDLSLSGMSRDGQPLVLSHDGTKLAYAWVGQFPASDADPVPSGVRIVDLETGEGSVVPVTGGRGVGVDVIAWSPNDRWIAWRGLETRYWTKSSITWKGQVAGRIDVRWLTSEAVPFTNDGSPAIGISEDGTVAVAGASQLRFWNGRSLSKGRWPVMANAETAEWSPGGDRVALGADHVRELRIFRPGLELSGNPAEPDRTSSLPLPSTDYPDGADVRPLGWVDRRHLVAAVARRDGNQIGRLELALMKVPASGDSRYQVIAHSDLSSLDSFSVATDLITDLDDPTHAFDKPDWPWSSERKFAVGGLSAVGIGVVAYLALAFVRRRRARHLVRVSR